MSNVKWIKLIVATRNGKSMKQIKALPDGYKIALLWYEIMQLAGECNENGFLYYESDFPYTEEMLAIELGYDVKFVKYALDIFRKLRMVELVDDIYFLSNWEKYQNVEGLEKIREQTRVRVARHRERQRLLLDNKDSNVTSNATETHCSALDIEEEIELDIDIDSSIEDKSSPTRSKNDPFDWKSFQDYWNNNSGLANIRQLTQSRKTAVNGRVKEYGLDTVHKVIDKCKESDFLQGKIKSNRKWVATFDWVFSPKNFIKILEGNYDNKETSKPTWYNDYEKDVKEYENKNNKEMTKEEKNKVFEDAKKIFGKYIKEKN